MGQGLLVDGARVELMVRMDAAHLFLSAQLRHRLHDRSHVDIRHLHPLVVVDLEGLVDDLGWTLDCEALVRALALGEALGSASEPAFRALLGFLLELSVLVRQSEQVLVILDLVCCSSLGCVLVELHRGHELALGQERVDLLHELEGGVLLVEDEGID